MGLKSPGGAFIFQQAGAACDIAKISLYYGLLAVQTYPRLKVLKFSGIKRRAIMAGELEYMLYILNESSSTRDRSTASAWFLGRGPGHDDHSTVNAPGESNLTAGAVFIGIDALLIQRAEGVRRMYTQLLLNGTETWSCGGEPIYSFKKQA